jgi:hypothetical protein
MVEETVPCPEKNDIFWGQLPNETVCFGVDVPPYCQVYMGGYESYNSLAFSQTDRIGSLLKEGLEKTLKVI